MTANRSGIRATDLHYLSPAQAVGLTDIQIRELGDALRVSEDVSPRSAVAHTSMLILRAVLAKVLGISEQDLFRAAGAHPHDQTIPFEKQSAKAHAQ